MFELFFWLSPWRTRAAGKANRGSRHHSAYLRVEQLETRETPAASFGWAFSLPASGGTGSLAEGVFTDPAGNTYLGGWFSGTIDMDPSTGTSNLTSAGARDAFVAKYDSGRNLIWARQFGDAGDDIGQDVAVDSAGNVYFSCTGKVVKLDSSGSVVWSVAISFQSGNSIAVDTAGNVYLGGASNATRDFDPGPGVFTITNAGVYDGYLVKLDTNGNFQWAAAVGTPGADRVYSIAVDSSGGVVAVGNFAGITDFDPGPGVNNLAPTGGGAFVWKLDTNGNYLWAIAHPGAITDESRNVAVSAAGNIYFTGFYSGTQDFDPSIAGVYNLTGVGASNDIFVSELDPAGNFILAKSMGGPLGDQGGGIAVDAFGNIFTTGPFGGTADFDPGPGVYNRTSAGSGDVFVSKLDPNGNFIWAASMGGTGSDFGFGGIGLDPAYRVLVCGRFQNTADFDPTPGVFNLTAQSTYDPFLVQLFDANVLLSESGGSTDVTEGAATDTYTMVLSALPTADVLVTLTPDSQLTTSPAVVTFTPANWNAPQTVTVSAADDSVIEGAHVGVLSASVTSADTGYIGVAVKPITAQITDNDAGGVTCVQSAGFTAVTEGGATDTVAVVLDTVPAASVTVTLTPDAQLTVALGVLTFTPANWNVPQTATISAVDDLIGELSPHSGSITGATASADPNYQGLSTATFTAAITDNDPPGVIINQSGGSTDVAEGGATDTYTVILESMPTANVVITFAPNSQVTASPAALTFAPASWSVPQTVTVTAVNDAFVEGAHQGQVTHTASSGDLLYNGLAIYQVTANITDNDVAGLTITQSGGSTNVTEGGATDTYLVTLGSVPTANVIVTLLAAAQLIIAPTAMTFTPAAWNVPQTVTVTAADDLVVEGAHAGAILHTTSSTDPGYNGLNAALTAGITDNDIAGLAIVESGGSTNVAEGGATDSYTVALISTPTATVTVDLGTLGGVAIASATLTFSPGAWNVPQTVTVSAVDDVTAQGPHTDSIVHTISGSDPVYTSLAPVTVVANIADNDVPGVSLSSTSLAVLEGATQTYSAVLTTPPIADVVVPLVPGPLLTSAPTVLTFTPTNWNVPQPVVVTAIDDSLVQGAHTDSIAHSAVSADPAYNGIAVPGVTTNILDNDGAVIRGTFNADKIIVTNSADLATLRVSVNGKTISVPSSVSQVLIDAQAGNDVIQLVNPLVPVVVLGGQNSDSVNVVGQAGPNAFTIGASFLDANGMRVSLLDVERGSAIGSQAADVFTVAATPLYQVACNGNQGSDQLVGADRPNTWQILNPNYGTLNSNIKFTSVENLTGGNSADGFFFSPGKSISGQIGGGSGNNMLNYALCTAPVLVNLQTAKATGLQSFANINQIVGGKSINDRLIGLDQANTWTITDWDAGTVNGVAFQNIENLTGGQVDDTFRLADNRGLKGKLDGGGGTDLLDYSSYLSRTVTINLQTHQGTNLAGLTNLEQFTGGAAADKFIAANLTNAWTLTSSNAGDVNGLSFTAFENLTGGAKNDSFTINSGADWTGLLDGGVGTDSLLSSGGLYVLTGPNAGLLNGRRFGGVEHRA